MIQSRTAQHQLFAPFLSPLALCTVAVASGSLLPPPTSQYVVCLTIKAAFIAFDAIKIICIYIQRQSEQSLQWAGGSYLKSYLLVIYHILQSVVFQFICPQLTGKFLISKICGWVATWFPPNPENLAKMEMEVILTKEFQCAGVTEEEESQIFG